MRKVHILCAAFFAVLAMGAISATAASAAPPLWLCGGVVCKRELAETTGTWLLLGLGIFGIKVHIECNGKLIGYVGPGSEDLVTEVTDLNGNAKISCEVLRNEPGLCELPASGNGLALVLAEHLPWETRLLLPTGTTEIVDHFLEDKQKPNGKPAFDVLCLLSGGTWTLELCEGNILTKALVNNASAKDVEGSVLKENTEKCNGANNTGHIEGKGLTKLALSTLTLSVSD